MTARRVLLGGLLAAACLQGAGPRNDVLAWTPVRWAAAPAKADFARDVRPILEARCRPCHFPGGVMYGKLPFDREATIHALGEKLFTRIKAADEQRTIRALLASPAR